MSRITRFILTMAVISLIGFIDLFAATAPSRQARYISFSNVTSTSVDITMVKGNGNNRIIVFSADGTVDSPDDSDTPFTDEDGTYNAATIVKTGSPDVVVDVLFGPEWTSSVTGLTAGVTYKVKVFEFNSDNSTYKNAYITSDYTNNPRNFTTLVTVNPPTALTANPVTATTADLSWTAADPAPDGYIFSLLVDDDGEGTSNGDGYTGTGTVVQPYDELDISDDVAFDLTDLVGPSDYKYQLYSYIGNSNSTVAEFEFFTPEDVTPPSVATIVLTGQTGNDGTIYEDDAGKNVTLTVTFSEAMKTWLTPTFAFSAASDLTYVTGSWNPAGDIFTATFLVGDSDQENENVDVTIGNAEDLAGLLISAGNPTATNVFTIDNKDGALSNFNYSTAGTNDNQPHCKSAANNDVIEIEIDLLETGYGAAGIDFDDFNVSAKDQANNDPIVFSSLQSGANNVTYLFTKTLTGTELEDDYDLTIVFTDKAGNEIIQTEALLFRIDNTPPVISNETFTNTCLQEGAVLSFSFDVVEEGCGTFDATNISISGLPAGNGVLSAPTITGNAPGPYNVAYTYTIGTTTPEGLGNVVIDVTDDAGNAATTSTNTGVFTVDKTAPTITNVALDNSCVKNTDVITLTFDVTDVITTHCGAIDQNDFTILSDNATTGTLTFEFAYQSVSTAGNVLTFTYAMTVDETNSIDDSYTVTIDVDDKAGNSATTNTDASFTVDNTKPVFSNFTITGEDGSCLAGGSTLEFTVDVVEDGCGTFNSSDINIGVTGAVENSITADGGNPTGTGTYTFTLLIDGTDNDGDYQLTFDGSDDAGNAATQYAPTGVEFSIDNTAPEISNVAVDKTCVNGGTTVTLSFDVAESGCGVFDNSLITISDNATTANSWTYSSGSGAGTYTYTLLIAGGDVDNTSVNVTVDADDAAGNSATPVTNTGAFAIDNTLPTVTIDDPIAAAEVNSSKVIDFTEDDGTGCGTMTTEASVNGGSNWTTIIDGVSTLGDIAEFGPLGDGAVTLSLRTTDGAGNVSSPVTTVALVKDATAPTVTLVTPSDQEISIADDGNVFTITIDFNEPMDDSGDNDPVVTITSNVTLANTNLGGSWSTDTRYIAAFSTVDANTPVALEDLDVTISGAKDDTEDDGNQMIEDNTTGADNFSIDTEAPTISFDGTSPAADDCVRGIETVEFTAADASAFSGLDEVRAKINFDDDYEVVTSGFALEDLQAWDTLSQGTFTLYLLALDDFGNETVVSRDFNKDDIAPQITSLSVTPSCVTEDDVVTITFSVEEEGCGTFNVDDIELTIDDSGFGPEAIYEPTVNLTGGTGTNGDPYTFSATFTILTSHIDGEYVVTVTATDDAGNSDSDFDTFDVDQTPPTLSNLVTSSVPGGNPTKVGGSAPNRELTIAFDEVTDGCASFDNGTITYIITGPGNTALTVSPAAPTKSVDTWTTTVTVPSNEPSGNYQIIIIAADDNGNADTLDPAGVEFVIDNTPPYVTSVTASELLLNRADDDGSAVTSDFDITVNFNEELDQSSIPDLEFHLPGKDPTSPAIALVFVAKTGPTTSSYKYEYSADKSTNIDMRGIGVRLNGAIDLVGNTQTAPGTKGNLFGIDFIAPQLNSITVNTPSPNIILDATTELELVFDFTETMTNTSDPTITFETGSAPNNATLANLLTFNAGTSNWNLGNVFTAKFAVDGSQGLEVDGVGVGITDATDLAGNPFPGSNESDVFDVDTREPACSGITMTPAAPVVIVADLDFDVSLVMDQTLDAGVAPTIAFTNSNANYTISNQAFDQTNVLNDTYTFTVTHDGTQENVTETMSISGFKDTHGNVQVTACEANFDVDTKLPEITSISVSDENICMSDDEAAYTIAIVFDEEMDGVTVPTLAFSPDHSAIFTGVSGAWSQTTVNNDTYTFSSTLDLSTGIDALVSIDVSGAKDLLGNQMDADTDSGDDAFSIDTEAPTVTDIAFNPTPSNPFGVNRSTIGAGGFQVAVTYGEEMNPATTPIIVFNDPQGGTGTSSLALSFTSGSWNSPTNTIYTAVYEVLDGDVELDGVDATITNGADLCGNVQVSSNPEPSFAIDLIAPTCVGLDVEYSLINENRLLLQELFANFSEPMDETIDVQFNFAVSGNFTVQNDGNWNDPDEYIVSAYHNGTEEGRFTETITLDLSGTKPKDLAGNPIESATCDYDFDVDTKKPLVESVTFTPTKVIGTTTTFSVDVEFNEAMENVVIPTLSFSAGSGAFALQGSSDWINGTHYIFDYVVTDIDIEETDVTVTINGAEDNAGNVMLAHVSTETFDIDQVEPTVTSVTFSSHPGWINRTNIGNGNFTVTVVYDEAMDNTMAPTIDLDPFAQGNPVLSDALVFASGSWSTGSNTDDTYTATYNVIDVAFADEQLGATISGGKDACGNTQVTYNTDSEGDGTIDIDLVNPTVVFDGFTPLAESCVNGTEAIDFTANDVNFFNKVEARIGAASFTTFTSGSDLSTVSGWGAASDGPITIELKALDLAGNTTTISRNFTKDATAPVIGGESFTNTCVTTGDVIDIEFTITETGCGTIVADNITASGFPEESNGVLSEPTITGNNPYVVTATYTVGSSDAQGVYDITFEVTDDAGNVATPSVNNNAFTIDKTAPTYSLIGSPSPSCANSSDVITLFITSEDIIFSCGPYGVSNITASTSLGAANVTTFGAPIYLISVDLSGTDNTDDGTYDIDIVMTDAAGNVRNETITNAFTIDNTAPAITNVAVTPGCENGGDIVTLTFDAVENGCGDFDQNDITINDNVATNNAWTYVSGSGSGTYEYTLLIDITDPDGAVDVTVSATDDAGNSTTNVDAGDTDFTIDNSAPDVAFDEPLTGATVNNSKEIFFTADDNDGCGVVSTEVRVNNGTWVNTTNGGTFLGDLTDFLSLGDVVFTLHIRSTDLAGNIGTNSVSLTKDETAPTVSSAVASDNVLSIADHGNAFSVAVNFNEGMDQTVNPIVTLTTNGTVDNTNTGGSWTTSTQFTATFGNVNGASAEEIADLDVTVSGAKDDTEDIGNTMTLQTIDDVFSIDTEAPTCIDITNNNADIYENDLSVTVSVQFTEDMATSPNPTFLITGTTELTPGASSWSGDTFTQTFTHTGVEEETSAKFEIDEFAALPTDLAGNPVSAVLCSTDVEIDTRKPLVTSVVFSTSLITESTTTLDVTVNFDEDMSALPSPTIGFNTPLPDLLTYNGYSNTSTSFTYNYSVADANLDLEDVTVDVAIGKDVAGNVMLTHTSTESFDIDQVAPTISTASIKSSNSIDDQYARVGHDIILTITPSEELNTGSFSGNIAGYSINSISDQYGLNGTYVLTVSTDPGVSAGLVTFSIDYEDVNGNTGTTLTAVTDPSSVTVDKTAPVGTIDLAGGQADPTSDSPINFALTFSEDVYGLTDGDIDVTGTAGATTAVVTGSGDTYNVAVTGMTGSGTVIINLANGKVTDIAANFNENTVLTDNSVQYDVSGATDVAAGAGVEPATLSSLVNTQGDAVLNFDFAVTDDGVVPAADLLATLITDIEISDGTGNDFGDWTTILAGAELTDGTNTVAVTTINSNSLEFNGLATGVGQIGFVADNMTKTYTLKVWLTDTPTGVIDNLNLAFNVNRSSFTVDGAGSSFAGGAGTDVESGATNNEVEVIATELTFTTTPVNTEINTNTTFVIDATDENGNRDVDYGPSTVTLTADQSTISSGGSGTLASGTLTLSAVQFSTAFANDYVTAADGTLTDGVSDNFNIKEEEPSAITSLSIVPNSNSFKINFTNPDNKNTLIIAKKTSSTTISYSNEAGMDNETSWLANTSYGSSATPSDASTFVIYAGSGATSVTMYNLINNFQRYTIAAYAYAGALNSGVQNFNENETSKSSLTMPKGSNYSENIAKGLSLGIDNITPQPASLNNLVSLQVETIEDMPLTLELYDSKGQKMMTLFEGRDFTSGETPFEFSLANTVSSGQHFLRLTGNGHVVIAPIMIVK